MSFFRVPEPVIVVVEPVAIVFGATSFTTASVEASPQSWNDTARLPACTNGAANPGKELPAGWLTGGVSRPVFEKSDASAAALVMICTQITLSPFDPVTLSV